MWTLTRVARNLVVDKDAPRARPGMLGRAGFRMAVLFLVTTGLVSCTHAGEPKVIGHIYKEAGPGTLGVDGSGDTHPSVGWINKGKSFYVTTYGSSSCPEAPTGMSNDAKSLKIVVTKQGGTTCPLDLGPTSYSLTLPVSLRRADHINVEVEQDHAGTTQLQLSR